MKWIIAALVAAALVAYFFASNISGGVTSAPVYSNLTMSNDTVQFVTAISYMGIFANGSPCEKSLRTDGQTHWTCPRPAGAEMKLSITR